MKLSTIVLILTFLSFFLALFYPEYSEGIIFYTIICWFADYIATHNKYSLLNGCIWAVDLVLVLIINRYEG